MQARADALDPWFSVTLSCQIASQPGDQSVGFAQGETRCVFWVEVFFSAACNTFSSSGKYNTVAGSCGKTRPSLVQAKTRQATIKSKANAR